MRVYIAHNMDDNEDLRARLELAKSEAAATRKLAKEGVELLRKTKEGKEATKVEACRLVEEKEAMEADKKNVEEEVRRLRQELQELRARFSIQKEELEAEYRKQVDDMFFYGYRCCIKKHGIAQDTPNFPSDDEDEAVGDPTRGEGYASRADFSNGHA